MKNISEQHSDIINLKGKKCNSLRELKLEDIEIVQKYIDLRPIYSCEYGIATLFMWKNMYSPHCYYDEHYLIIFEHYEGECYSLMPLCEEEYFIESFQKARDLFEEMEESFEMYCVDEIYAEKIKGHFAEEFKVVAPRELADYIYDAEKMRMLTGEKLRKKKNHINAFLREFDGQYSHRSLLYNDFDVINDFIIEWCQKHKGSDEEFEEESIGIRYLIENQERLNIKTLGVFIHGKLEAMSIASLINQGMEAIIHVEKANADIRGLYPFINQLFLKEYLTEVIIVNREDDLGIEGLRKAKMSYEPIRLENKYTITKHT